MIHLDLEDLLHVAACTLGEGRVREAGSSGPVMAITAGDLDGVEPIAERWRRARKPGHEARVGAVVGGGDDDADVVRGVLV